MGSPPDSALLARLPTVHDPHQSQAGNHPAHTAVESTALGPVALDFSTFNAGTFSLLAQHAASNGHANPGVATAVPPMRSPKTAEVVANHKLAALLQRAQNPAWETEDIADIANLVVQARGAISPWELADRLKSRGEAFTNQVFRAIASRQSDAGAHPILLFHGFAAAPKTKGISPEIIAALRDRGHTVYEMAAPAFAPPEQRAQVLAPQMNMVMATGASKLHAIAHSLGGFDIRYLISRMGWGDRVASVTTLGTPHQGSPAADAFRVAVPYIAYWALDLAGEAVGAAIGNPFPEKVDVRRLVQSMTPAGAKRFNEANPNHPGVLYQSIGGQKAPSADHPLVVLASLFTGKGDGVVPVDSAKWGSSYIQVPATHTELRGDKAGTFNATKLFVGIVDGLGKRGL